MEIWKHCWSCEHVTPQKRIYYKMYPRPIEGFSKDKVSGKATSFWTIVMEIYQFCECKKCEAPILHTDEYLLPRNKENDLELTIQMYRAISDEVERTGDCIKYEKKTTTYPHPHADSLKKRKWSFNLPEEDMLLFFEVISAWDEGLYILALSGIRTLIDRYMVKLVGDIGGFKTKLNQMLEDKHINKKQYELLEIVIEAGNAAGHRGFRPNKEMLDNLLHVVEDIISLEFKTLDFSNYSEQIPKRRN
ncbi:DUF4145 domain-containing protein [Acinetobacter baumannii]|uniref:DUF4145 domain-containing protein n=2 Tax=Acinetobacter TaxID=469 RepID=UPI000A34ADD8|nr:MULTISPECIES: DUF4145 domain-containing protein [Acinetobacter calcoaceticus/baumannii complex]MDC4579410.1 DUF4145 domain-containing protein [Acinetobacter baumannii]MDH2510452.1 DUF4145 domain-containing protein [Acinetobacter baumannii]MDQ8923107.1 DUF4145 domain-containing protein [Acinetobacter baumannii]MDQ8926517.1 DUF4145 domain-containing protein [Acinetobacter baumannii]MDQ8933443.1 DUF4145 domain-containing protein [Acinetobacter baumannii]